MSRKYVLIKSLNLIIILALLCGYQAISVDRAGKEEAAIAKAKKAQAERKAQQQKEMGISSPYKDGEYEGSAEGYGGQVVMKVVIEGGVIKEVRPVSHSGEDQAYWEMAEGITSSIVDAQSTDVDTVSGATYTSTGIINAATKGLQQALK